MLARLVAQNHSDEVIPPFEIHPDLLAFFEFTRARVTRKDIENNVPNDPGFTGYIRSWEGMRRTGQIPGHPINDVSEVIGLSGWGRAGKTWNPDSFRAFRRFTGAVGVIFLHQDWTWGDVLPPPNCLACNLLRDLDPDSRQSLRMLRRVFAATTPVLKAGNDNAEYLFFILGEMLLAQWDDDFPAAGQFAGQLLHEEQAARLNEDINDSARNDRFLLGLAFSSQLNREWLALAGTLENPDGHPDTAKVILLLNGARTEALMPRPPDFGIHPGSSRWHGEHKADENQAVLRAFLDFTRSRVTPADIERNVPVVGPEGSADRKIWNKIWRSGKIPQHMAGALAMAGHLDGGDNGGRPFRQFAGAVGLYFIHQGWSMLSFVTPRRSGRRSLC